MAAKTRWPNISASLDHFIMNKIFFITLFFIKTVRLATIQRSGIKMPCTRQNGPFEYRICPVFGGSLYCQILRNKRGRQKLKKGERKNECFIDTNFLK
jgi:hypothetical protein